MKLIGVILNGGKSSRMGINKADLIYMPGQMSFLDTIYQKLYNLEIFDEIVISGKTQNYFYIEDEINNRGPLEGIRCVLKFYLNKNKKCRFFVMPIDMPFIDKEEIVELVNSNPNYDVAFYQTFNLPLIINDASTVLSHIDTVLQSGRKSINELLCPLNKLSITTETNNMKHFFNINTPGEYKSAFF